MIEIRTLGGYKEIGRNMTAIKINDDVFIVDCGIHLPNYIAFTEDEDVLNLRAEDLIAAGAIPDPGPIMEWEGNVKAIIPSHAHLDHIGAIPYLAGHFPDAKIIATPFTLAVLKQILKDEKIKIPNKFIPLNTNHSIDINGTEIEFVNMTHSTPQTVTIAFHTEKGVITYSNDFKLDNAPLIGKKPNYAALEKISKKGVLASIIDCLYAPREGKCPSETVAREMLKDVLLNVDSSDRLVVVTTFSSHIARLRSIIDFGKKLNREIILLGRSLSKYVRAAETSQVADFKDVKILKYNRQLPSLLKKINKNRNKYLLIVTGHQGEPKAKLSRLAKGDFDWKFKDGDHVIFSCNIIPSEIQIENRKQLENVLRSQGVRLFKDIHVSGHAFREDLRDLINILNPEHLIPSHGNEVMDDAFVSLAASMKIPTEKVLVLNDKESVRF